MTCAGDAFFWFAIYFVATAFAWSLYRAWLEGKLLTVPIIAWGMPLALMYYPLATTRAETLACDQPFALLLLSGAVGTAIGLFINRHVEARHEKSSTQPSVIPAWIIDVGALLYFGFLWISVFGRVQKSGGVIEALTVARLEEFLGGAILEGRSLEVLFILPQILYFIAIGRLMARGRWAIALAMVATLSAYYVFTANTRLPIVFPWVAFAIVAVQRMPLKRFRVIAPVAAGVATAAVGFIVVVGSALRLGTLESLSESSEGFSDVLRSQATADLGYPDWVKDLQRSVDNGQINPDYGYGWIVLGTLSIVPRVIWPDKPLTSASNRLTELVYGARIGDGTAITTFTIYGDGYFQGMYLGVGIAALFFVCGYGFLLAWMRRLCFTEFWSAMVLLHMVTFFRGEVPVPDFIVWAGALSLFSIVAGRGDVRATGSVSR
jgi:hypothetical protein